MIVPFMNFHGQCEAAVLYYQTIFKFEDPLFLKFNQVQNVAFTIPEDYGNKVMFTEFRIADQKIFACDVYPGLQSTSGQSISLNVIHSSLEDIQTWFDALSKEGVVGMPIQATPWAPQYGSCTDKYGIVWQFSWDNKKGPMA